jgi:type II secretory pathway pseudopilin PulG
MKTSSSSSRFSLGVIFLMLSQLQLPTVAEDRVEFNRDIRPILSDYCYSCHGPDEKSRQASLRLDIADAPKVLLPSGKMAIVPGRVADSELVRRILSDDPNERMPPLDSSKQLTPVQIDLLKRWVAQGAEYQKHWSFVAPKRPRIDHARDDLALGQIDSFIHHRLQMEGLKPSPPADKERLIRRITLDLTGTPPTLNEIDRFLADDSPDAYEKIVDRLLASPRYGERMALDWLDAARYADTHGFNNDTTRYMWRWRDWTIDAFNSGMPFDQFVTEQLAGDLLPNPTLEQRIATGFNRNHVINSEGGIIPEEYRVEYVADRVHTTATIFLGLSMGCARCHDHKFDPITQREYYQFFAFFNQLNEQGEAGRVGNAEPTIKAPTPGQAERLSKLMQQLAAVDQQLQQRITMTAAAMSEWEPKLRSVVTNLNEKLPMLRWTLDETNGIEVTEFRDPRRKGQVIGKGDWVAGKVNGAIKLDGNSHIEGGDLASFERTDCFSFGAWINVENKDGATVISRMDDANAFRGFDLLLVGGKLTAHLIHRWPDEALHVVSRSEVQINQWKHVFATYDGSSKGEGLKLYVDGKKQEVEITNNFLTATTITTNPLRIGRRTSGAPFRGMIDDVRIYDCELTAEEVLKIAGSDSLPDLLAIAPEQRTADQNLLIAKAWLNRFDADFQTMSAAISRLEKERSELEKSVPSAMVMQEMPQPRVTYFLNRGQYDAPGDEVKADVPVSLPRLPNDAPRNRLGLAKWLFLSEHPLTARVAVNRAWMQFFGNGLVETVEDFGAQGQWPVNLDLLNWLASEYAGVSDGKTDSVLSRKHWDTKRLYRQMVCSATYRQSSRTSREMHERDPANKLLARGPRFRLQAEMIRDNALALAGLLIDRTGGPSVSPYQPAGLWDDVAVGADYEGTVYKQDKGEGLYRRSMYTFWKRTCPPPGLNTFDAPEREVCTARRSRTNTPLQSLVLMNDPTYLEASRRLAERVIQEGSTTAESRLTFAFRLATSRMPTPQETQVLLKTFQQRLAHYQQDPAAARALISIGESARDETIGEVDLAAWTSVMSLILNLDEVITKG